MFFVILYSEQDLVDEAFNYIEVMNKWVTIGNHSLQSLKN